MFMIRFSGVMVKIPRGKKIKDLSCFGVILQCDNNQKLFVEQFYVSNIFLVCSFTSIFFTYERKHNSSEVYCFFFTLVHIKRDLG